MYKGISAIELKKSELRSLERFPAPLRENVLRGEQVRIHEISRSPSSYRPPKIRVPDGPTDGPTDRRTNGRTNPHIESWLTTKNV